MSISKIVIEHTMYNNFSCRRYLSVADLLNLVDVIKMTGKTTGYLRFTPFYINALCKRQIEFDEKYMYYVEFRNAITQHERFEFVCECADLDVDDVNNVLYQNACKQYMLLEKNDVLGFHSSLDAYCAELSVYIKQIVHEVEDVYHVDHDNLLLGSVCFEIHCGDYE